MEGKVLVTGSNGQLGQCFKYISNYSFMCDASRYVFVTREDFDITNDKMMKNYLDKYNDIKIIINCAAYTDVKGAESEEGYKKAMLANRNAVKSLARLCKERNIFLIHFGTDYMFNTDVWHFNGGNVYHNEFLPVDEEAIHWRYRNEFFNMHYVNSGEINKYGLSKLLGIHEIFNEMLPKHEDKVLKPNFVIIVVSWLYSPYGKNFVRTIRELLKKDRKPDEKIEVVYTQVGSPTYAMDLARYVIDVIENDDCCFIKNPNEYNIVDYANYFHMINFSNLGVASWYDIAKVIENIYCLTTDNIIPRKEPLDSVFRPSYSVLDTKKLIKFKSNKNYVRHWLDALNECIIVIRSNEIKKETDE
jgi:dTDP-4-dehydrorhamnose reductase